jgi:hypothetical protein
VGGEELPSAIPTCHRGRGCVSLLLYINEKFCGTPLLPYHQSACKRYGGGNSSVLLLAYSLKDGKDMIGGMEKKGGGRVVT